MRVEIKNGKRSPAYCRARNFLALICVLALAFIAQLPETHAQRRRALQVTLTASPASPAPILVFNGPLRVKLTAAVTGGDPTLPTRYSFYIGPYETLQENGPSPSIVWIPKYPGYHFPRVIVRHFIRNRVVSEVQKQIEYEVKLATLKVTLQPSPPSGQAVAPPPSPSARLTLKAGAALPVQPQYSLYLSSQWGKLENRFHFYLSPGYGPGLAYQLIGGTSASWTPDPPQPATPGTYGFNVQVETVRLSDNTFIATGKAVITDYQVLGGPFSSFTVNLYPVYSHDRCVFCHGVVDPPTGRAHPQTTMACTNCHNVRGWTNVGADPYVSWSGSTYQIKSAGEICNIVKNTAQAASRPTFLDFVQNFSLIKWAYSPTGPSYGGPPPGDHSHFVKYSMDWFDAGKPCP